jgi:uncharacterized protein with HEPN domain
VRFATDSVDAIDTVRTYLEQPESDEETQKKILIDAVDRQLTIVAEAAGQLSSELRARRPEIDWAAIRGFRQRLVHRYWEYDRDIANSVVNVHLEPLRVAMIVEMESVEQEKPTAEN